MKNERPSIFTIYLIIGIVIFIIFLITTIVAVKKVKSGEENNSYNMEKIDSISGDENIELDENGNRINSSSKILSKKEVDGFVFDSFNVSSDSGISTITFEIYNPEEQDKELGEYEVQVLDSSSNLIGRITDNAGIIEGLSRKEVSVQIKGDIANLTDLQIRKIIYEDM